MLIQSRRSESKTCQKMGPHHPPRQIPPRFLSQEHQKRGGFRLGELMRLEMPLQRAYPKATVRAQVLERCQVIQDHLPNLSRGRDHSIKITPPPTRIFRLAPKTENQVSLDMEGHAEVLRGLRRSDFFMFITIPRVRQSKRRDWTVCLAAHSDEGRTNQMSRYRRSQIPCERAYTDEDRSANLRRG